MSGQELATRSGFVFVVRPAEPEDRSAIEEFFDHVTPEDMRFRFLGAVKPEGDHRLAAMIDVDHERTDTFVARERDDGPVIAVATLVCDAEFTRAEVAVSIRADYKSRGIGWELLGFVTRIAQSKGVKRLQSLESRENRSAIELERERGFVAIPYEGDRALVILEKVLSP